MQPVLPTWFKQRQAKAEPAGESALRLTGPNLNEAFIRIHQAENGRWSAALRQTADGPDVATTEPRYDPTDAWGAAFELYRVHLIV
jgi:hypothetical protein